MPLTNHKILSICLSSLLISSVANATNYLDTNIARMQAMDKITGRVSEIDVPVNGETNFGSFSIVVRRCVTSSPEETPENIAFVDVTDNYNHKTPINIFKGWMFSSSPALNAVEHPIYDVWLLKCINGKVDSHKLLSATALEQRDKLSSTQSIVEELPQAQNQDNKSLAENISAVSETNNIRKEASQEVVSVVVSSDDINTEENQPKELFLTNENSNNLENNEENGFEE